MSLLLGDAIATLNSDSDEDDDDYVPSGNEESEDDINDAEPENDYTDEKRKDKRPKKIKSQKIVKSRKRKGGITLSDDESRGDDDKDNEPASPSQEPDPTPTVEAEKKKADSLWEDFLSDVTPPPKKVSRPPPTSISTPTSKSPVPSKLVPKPEKVTITKVFEFAGESVEVKEEVDSNSKAAKEFAEEQQREKTKLTSPSSSSETKPPASVRRPNGLDAVLGKVLGKKSKLSTLEKSKLDWNKFKKDEGVEEVLDQYKKSKGGYLDRQAFLERADLRQFEIEKDMRAVNRNHRL